MEESNVILNKIETIERCINRINTVYGNVIKSQITAYTKRVW